MASKLSIGGHIADIGSGLGSGIGGIIGGVGGGITNTVGGVTNGSPWNLLLLGGVAYLLFAKPAIPSPAGSTPLPATHSLARQTTS